MLSLLRLSLLSLLLMPVSASAGMPLQGKTSQPIGHYEFCKSYADRCGPNQDARPIELTPPVQAKLEEVNDAVNIGILPKTDEEMYGVPEKWAYPTTEGDCEDYALLKQYMLERAGYPRSSLLLTVLRQMNGAGHAVLTVTTDKGDIVLDNLEEEIRDWAETTYTFLKRQSAEDSSKWVSIVDDRELAVGSVR